MPKWWDFKSTYAEKSYFVRGEAFRTQCTNAVAPGFQGPQFKNS